MKLPEGEREQGKASFRKVEEYYYSEIHEKSKE